MNGPDRSKHEGGIALVITMLVLVLLLALGTSLLATATVESTISVNERWSEGAFYAAEAAVQETIDQLAQGNPPAAVPLTELGDNYTYRSGGREDDDPTAPVLIGTIEAAGYSLGTTTGYSGGQAGQFVYEIYQINGTGMGPQNSVREIEVQVAIGPKAL